MLAAAVRAASEAGTLMKSKIGAEVVKTKYNPKDLLTEVDAQCQNVIEKVMAEKVGDAGEEGRKRTFGTSGYSDAIEILWVLTDVFPRVRFYTLNKLNLCIAVNIGGVSM